MKLSCLRTAGTVAFVLVCAICSVLASTPCDQNVDTWAKWCTQNGKPDGPFNNNVCADQSCTIMVTDDAYLLLPNGYKTDTVCLPYIPSMQQQVTWKDSKTGLATFDINFDQSPQSSPFVHKTEFSGHFRNHYDSDNVSGDALGCYAFSIEHCPVPFIGCKKNDPRVIVQGMGLGGSAARRKKPH